MKERLIAHISASKFNHLTFDYIAILILGFLLRIPFLPATGDDAFITFRYVRNIITGQGFVFNIGEHVLGTTTPFYTLYLALVGKAGLDFILVGKLTNILADIASSMLLFVVIFRASNRLVAWVVALLHLSSPFNLQYSANGMETGIYTFMIFFAFYLYEQRQWKLMTLVAGILVLVRPDGLLALLVIGLFWLIDRQEIGTGIKYALITGLIMLPWLIFATWYFGSPIPQSVTAKALTYRSPVPMEFLSILWYISAQASGTVGALLYVVLMVTGSIAILSQHVLRPLRIYVVWMVLYIATFTLFQSGRFGWYYAPVMPILFTITALGGAEWFKKLRQYSAMTLIMQSKLRYVLVGSLFVALFTISGVAVFDSWQNAYREIVSESLIWRPLGLCIKENSSPEATVALESIGGVGWYSERYIFDEGGLVSKKTYTLNLETPGKINALGILQTYRPDFFITWKPWELETLNTPEAQLWFEANYVLVNRYSTEENTWTLFQLINSENVENNIVTECNKK